MSPSRRHTLLPLDDCLYALQPTIPHLTRSSLHRCLQRHDISRLPQTEGDKEPRRKFKIYPIGFFHVDIAEVQTAQGKLYPSSSQSTAPQSSQSAQLVDTRPIRRPRAPSWRPLSPPCPTRVEIVLTDNGIQFADLPKNRDPGPTARLRGHPFDRACREHGIEHRLTKPNHPWTNGQVERMNRTIKDATVKRYHYESHEQLVRHLDDFVAAYNFGRRLKTLSGLTPFEFVCKITPLTQADSGINEEGEARRCAGPDRRLSGEQSGRPVAVRPSAPARPADSWNIRWRPPSSCRPWRAERARAPASDGRRCSGSPVQRGFVWFPPRSGAARPRARSPTSLRSAL